MAARCGEPAAGGCCALAGELSGLNASVVVRAILVPTPVKKPCARGGWLWRGCVNTIAHAKSRRRRLRSLSRGRTPRAFPKSFNGAHGAPWLVECEGPAGPSPLPAWPYMRGAQSLGDLALLGRRARRGRGVADSEQTVSAVPAHRRSQYRVPAEQQDTAPLTDSESESNQAVRRPRLCLSGTRERLAAGRTESICLLTARGLSNADWHLPVYRFNVCARRAMKNLEMEPSTQNVACTESR